MKTHTAIAVAIAIGVMLAIGVAVFWPLFAALRVNDATRGDIDAVIADINENESHADRALFRSGVFAVVFGSPDARDAYAKHEPYKP